MKRRKFLRRTAQIIAAAAAAPFLISSETSAKSKLHIIAPEIKPKPADWKDTEINVAWLGHATVLINFYGKIILTDPVLFERVGLYFWGITFGPNRYTYPALEADEIPKPDLVLLSHGHMDHTDFKTLTTLTKKFPHQIDCITAFNTKDITDELKWKSITEMDWGESLEMHGISFKALEVKHFGWRFPWERDRSKGFMSNGRSYNAYILERNNKKILFGGDTAFHDLFLQQDVRDIDIALMPIGAYEPWRRNHCNPEEALIMASEHMDAKYFVPIHCNTFKQGTEPIDEPLNWMRDSVKNYSTKIGINKIGETLTI